ncbi:MAG TPA: hypothetical protein VLY83_05310 [Methanoregula sp.]|nr:hypothetical protein [Methanoregula sp.]
MFFSFPGYGHVLLFSTTIGLAMLVPLIGAQFFLLIFLLYKVAPGTSGAPRSSSSPAVPSSAAGSISITGR